MCCLARPESACSGACGTDSLLVGPWHAVAQAINVPVATSLIVRESGMAEE